MDCLVVDEQAGIVLDKVELYENCLSVDFLIVLVQRAWSKSPLLLQKELFATSMVGNPTMALQPPCLSRLTRNC